MQITISTNFPDVQRALGRLQAGVRESALTSAINKTLDQAKTAMVRGITAEFNVKAGYVRERLRVVRASKRGGLFAIEGSLRGGSERKRSANIIAFVERSTSLAQAKKRRKAGTLGQLFVKVKRNGPAKALKGAFIGNKGRTVFRRTGKARLPIEPVQVIDVGQMFNTRRINSVVVATMKAKFPQVFAREAKFFTDRFNRGSGR
jgi:Prophage minor tail protein Z (GPZ)